MTEHDSRWMYRQTIDAMVVACLQGQGQVSAERIRVGVWNPNADAETDPNQVTMNALLGAMEESHRQALSMLVAEEFASGIFNALTVLAAAKIEPFVQGYDGEPSDDFLGRIDGSDWPEGAR